MKATNRIFSILSIALASALLSSACGSLFGALSTPTPEATATAVPSPTQRLEVNVALGKPVRVSASWVKDPPERAVNGNTGDWWGAGGPAPQWIEVDLGGLYSVSRIRIINEGPTGPATYRVLGRAAQGINQLLHEFPGSKYQNQTLEFTPDEPWQDISTIRIEIPDGSGWVGFREIQVFSREDSEALESTSGAATPLFLAGVQPGTLAPISPGNAGLIKQLAMLGRGTVNELAWSPDGKTLAAAGALGVWLYDPKDLDVHPRLLEGHTRDVLGAAFSADGMNVYSASQDGTVKQWDAATGALKNTMPLWNDFSDEVGQQKRDAEVWRIAFNLDRTLLASGTLDGTIRTWNLRTSSPGARIRDHSKQITALAFSPDGKLLASSGADGLLLLSEVATGNRRVTLDSGPALALSLAFSPDGRALASAGPDQMIHLWDVSSGKEVSVLKGHAGAITGIVFSPDGQTLASSGSDGTLRFWDVPTGKGWAAEKALFSVTSMAFSPDGARLATSTTYGTVHIWDRSSGREVDVLLAHTGPVTSVAFSPNGAFVAAGGEDGLVRFWDVERNKLAGVLIGSGGITGIEFSPDGASLAASSFDGEVHIWDTASGKPIRILSGHKSYVRGVAFSPDGRTIASGGTDRTVRLWDSATGNEIATLKGHTGEVESVAFSPDGAWLVSASADQTLRIWDVKTHTLSGVLTGHQSFVLGAAFSPDGTMLASAGGDHWLRVWDLSFESGAASGTNHFQPIGHGGWVLSTAFSPDGSLVAAAAVSTTSYWVAPGEIHLYSADSGFPFALLRAHTKRVTSTAFSPDGKLLASGSADGSVRLWGITDLSSQSLPQPTARPSTPTPLPTIPSSTPTAQPTAPPLTPTPTRELPTNGNLALHQLTTASRSESWRPSSRAVDGNSANTDWGSGDFAPQWIEIDLGAPATIEEIRLLVTQDPNGETVHRILVGATPGKLKEVHRFEGFTRSGQWLEFKLEQPLGNVQIVRIETLKSPSWVGWVEIEVLGKR